MMKPVRTYFYVEDFINKVGHNVMFKCMFTSVPFLLANAAGAAPRAGRRVHDRRTAPPWSHTTPRLVHMVHRRELVRPISTTFAAAFTKLRTIRDSAPRP